MLKNHISSEIRNYNELSENLGIDLRDTQKNKEDLPNKSIVNFSQNILVKTMQTVESFLNDSPY